MVEGARPERGQLPLLASSHQVSFAGVPKRQFRLFRIPDHRRVADLHQPVLHEQTDGASDDRVDRLVVLARKGGHSKNGRAVYEGSQGDDGAWPHVPGVADFLFADS